MFFPHKTTFNLNLSYSHTFGFDFLMNDFTFIHIKIILIRASLFF